LWLGGEAFESPLLADVAASLVLESVDRDATDPADRIVVVHDAAPPQVRFDEGVLNRIRGPLLVAARDGERADETPVVGAEERLEVVDHSNVVHTNNSHQNGHAEGPSLVWLPVNVQFTAMSLRELASVPRSVLATLPTPLERGPRLGEGPRLWVKRDDLTGLGAGGNKARKLEFLCGEALAAGADCLITVGAGQSNHCRMTAAAGARLGLETHLVLGGDKPASLAGNQLLSDLFGAHLHFTGVPSSHWGPLEIARETLTAELALDGLHPHSIPIGGSTAVGALGYVAAFMEMMEQCAAAGITPAAIVFASSSGGTHAGLVAGRALWRSLGHEVPDVIAIGVAKGIVMGMPDISALAADTLALIGASGVAAADVEIDTRWLGDDYGIPTDAADRAILWAARKGGWVLDRTYSGKGFAGLLGNVKDGRWGGDTDVIFVHTGGLPAVFAPGGAPS
jgi:1-aminocyclopropane-1-carboxylate deaminase/D-cysteine desulfhydrase-like pyridoxal-dependent ACC family enzyme